MYFDQNFISKCQFSNDQTPFEAEFINYRYLFIFSGSRITTFFNFGYVALTIKYVTIHDVGVYTCRAYNTLGQAETTAQMSVITKQDIVFDSQHPSGLQKIQHLEDSRLDTHILIRH